MCSSLKLAYAALALACLTGTASSADPPVPPGREIFVNSCQACHGGTAPADLPIGPSLVGVFGKRAATQLDGVHSRAVTDSGIVWDRDSLRRFLAAPSREIPGTYMPIRIANPVELESLLDYLQSLR